MRAPLVPLLALALTAAACGGTAPADPPPATYTNPVVRPIAADPTVVRADDGSFYLFATEDDWADGQGTRYVPIFRSADLVDWAYVGEAFDGPVAWRETGGYWAPHAMRRGSGFSLYYSYSIWDDPNPCIGLATADRPEGPWADLGRPVFCADDIGVENGIDPFVTDEGGAPTMIWGSFTGIFAVPLTPDGTAPAGEKVRLADDRFEAAFVHRRGGFFYLFVSAGSCCEGAESTYEVYAGRSASLTGPYVDRAGRDLRQGGGERVLAANETWVGPGHVAVVTDDAGTDWLFFHAIPRDDPRTADGNNRRPALLDRIEWQDGWPVVNGGAGPSTTAQDAPTIHGRPPSRSPHP